MNQQLSSLSARIDHFENYVNIKMQDLSVSMDKMMDPQFRGMVFLP
jgi:hypothetical protein